jgi:regulatory protein
MSDETVSGSDEALLKAKSDALRLLSFQARSVEELKKRLVQKKHPPELADRVIEVFKKQGLLDDEKFARLLANSKVSRPTGRRRLEADMKKKGLKADVISRAIGGLEDYDEKKMARELAQSRYQRIKDLPTQKIKARLFGLLARRGFRSDTIYAVVAELFKNDRETHEG